ncbi:MAG: NAD(P)-dependent oxidoreductase [Parcubacteria group bacterium]|nr:NAD(P)-dependent oxidoreductase [Parcubacteria group bacterium]
MRQQNPPSPKASAGRRKKILITGAGGYVGSTIAAILKDDYEVVGFGHPPSLKATEGQVARIIKGDIADYKALSRAAKGVYAIIHTASPTKESWCKEHPYEALRAIVYGARNVRHAAEEHKVPLVVHFSTQAVYSNFAKRPLPLREDMELQPDTFYGSLKAIAEHELLEPCLLKTKDYRLKTVIIRPANIYGVGAGVLRRNVVSTFAENARNGKPLIVSGDGKQKVDFVHVRDIARLVKLILAKPAPKKTFVLNAGSGAPTAIKTIAQIILKVQKQNKKKPPEIISQPVPAGTIAADRWLSIAKAKKLYNWKPEITLERGVKELLQE